MWKKVKKNQSKKLKIAILVNFYCLYFLTGQIYKTMLPTEK